MKKQQHTKEPIIINYHFFHIPIKYSQEDLLLHRVKNLTTAYKKKFMAERNYLFHAFEVEINPGEKIKLAMSFAEAISKLEAVLKVSQSKYVKFIQNKIDIILQMQNLDTFCDSYFYLNWVVLCLQDYKEIVEFEKLVLNKYNSHDPKNTRLPKGLKPGMISSKIIYNRNGK